MVHLLGSTIRAQSSQKPVAGGRINQLKVLSDKIDDVTTVENILRSFVRPGMSDQDVARRSGRPW